jgi:DivIVA domain-containing protein
MNITPQDILEQEFHVRFRGFDMAEVDAFLEKVAEGFSKILEENRLLSEQAAELQKTSGIPDNLDSKLQEVIDSVKDATSQLKSLDQHTQPEDLSGGLAELKQVAERVSSELAGLKEDRQAYTDLEQNLKEAVASAKEVAEKMKSGVSQDSPGALPKEFEEIRQSTDSFGSELADIKKEIGNLHQTREQLQSELRDLLQVHFGQLEERFLKELRGITVASSEPQEAITEKPAKKAKAKATEHKETDVLESRVLDEDAELPGYDDKEPEDSTHYDEADILNEDKLRDLFASIMDDDESPQEEETASDSLFGGQNLVEDGHEPEVTFILDDALQEDGQGEQAGEKPDN